MPRLPRMLACQAISDAGCKQKNWRFPLRHLMAPGRGRASLLCSGWCPGRPICHQNRPEHLWAWPGGLGARRSLWLLSRPLSSLESWWLWPFHQVHFLIFQSWPRILGVDQLSDVVMGLWVLRNSCRYLPEWKVFFVPKWPGGGNSFRRLSGFQGLGENNTDWTVSSNLTPHHRPHPHPAERGTLGVKTKVQL